MFGKLSKWIALDHQSLFKQRLFWVMIGVPIAFFFGLGCVAWWGSSFQFDHEGFNGFIHRSRLPLGFRWIKQE